MHLSKKCDKQHVNIGRKFVGLSQSFEHELFMR